MRFALFVLVIAACNPLYGGRPEPLHKVVAVKPPPTPAAEAVHYVDECPNDFHASARAVHPQPKLADPLIKSGDDSVAAATPEHFEKLVTAIQHYADALRLDPYNAHATLALAVAYDRVLHRGCALAMLRRLEALSQNPKVAPGASERIADVVDNPQWFKGYRKDALAAVNR